MATVDAQIASIGKNVSENIDRLSGDRGVLSQNFLQQLRHLVEAVAVRLHTGSGKTEFDYALTSPAVKWLASTNKSKNFLYRFHKRLQMSVSHYTLDEDASERLMLKYYEYIARTRSLLKDECGIEILGNLESFPIDLDPALKEYHEQIAARLEAAKSLPADEGRTNRYYVNKVRPFVVDGRVYYEVTFSNISDRQNKSDRIIAFTHVDMTDKYAANLTLLGDEIDVLGQMMPITIIRDWHVSIRPCEFDNFGKLFGHAFKTSTSSAEYRGLMQFLTDTSASLLDLMEMSDAHYAHVKSSVLARAKSPVIFPVLDEARALVMADAPGANVIRYLLLDMHNRIIKAQYAYEKCARLSGLYLSYGTIPFDRMPFCSALQGHPPRFSDVTTAISVDGREHELLARVVKNNVERHGLLFTPLADLAHFDDVPTLVSTFNSRVYYKHGARKLEIDKGHVFIRGYEDTTVAIVEKLRAAGSSGVAGYGTAVERWLDETTLEVDDPSKADALKRLFVASHVALIYGAAGTGKSTMVNYIANYFDDKSKLFLAHTNPAKDNLERKVSTQHATFRTITSQIHRSGIQPEYDLLVIDECSTVSNEDLLAVLENTKFKLLILVGDIYQIEAIQFGNWFGIAKSFVPPECVFELKTPYRSTDVSLVEFWLRVRLLEQGIEESIARNGYSAVLGEALFKREREDEIVLCLNYDGLYGINNVNRFLQRSNPGHAVTWGVNTYKVGDPVLFSDTERFKPLIYNNLKGKIADIGTGDNRITFDVWLDRPVTEIDVDGLELEYVDDATVRFSVYLPTSTDDDDLDVDTTVPFQVAYAVSIHKAQGLEYDSVKVVITNSNEEAISHNIFYTAITRAREALKIFWTPESQKAVLDRLEHIVNHKDVSLLEARGRLKRWHPPEKAKR